jgi:hypothetical protein
MRPKLSNLAVPLCGVALVALTLFGLTLPQPIIGQFGVGYGAPLNHFVLLTAVQGVVYVAAVAALLKAKTEASNLWFILAVAALMRMGPLLAPPFLSNDMYRYIWDGWVQAAGINPYRYIPADAHLAFLRDTVVYPNINRATYAHTIYPPAAEMVFYAASQISVWLHLPPVLGMKLAMLGCEAIAIAAITQVLRLAGMKTARILIYAWNPLPVWEFSSSGHVDAIAIGFTGLALLFAARSKTAQAGAALAAAVLTKFLPLVLVPAIWRRWDWKFAMAFTSLIGLCYLPYLGVGAGVFGFLGGYGAQEGIDSGHGIFLLAVLGRLLPLPSYAASIYLGLLAAILLVLAWPMMFGRAAAAPPRTVARHFLVLAGILMLGLSPHYPWYYAWLLLPACIVPASSILYLVTASSLLYLNPTHTKLFWPCIVYGPFIGLALRDLNFFKQPRILGHAMAEGDQS